MIIIPMAGNSSRFFKAGYTQPKYELLVGSNTLFALSVGSFKHYFNDELFVFVCRENADAARFVANECRALGVAHFEIVELDGPTSGQAETVLIGLDRVRHAPHDSILIFNIDTIRPNYVFPESAQSADAYLEVFRGAGEHWSFVRPAATFSNLVSVTTEKKRISDLCCTGLYHFARSCDFEALCRDALANAEAFKAQWKELYVAPMYNTLIEAGKRVQYHVIGGDEVIFSGTPDEYQALLATDRNWD